MKGFTGKIKAMVLMTFLSLSACFLFSGCNKEKPVVTLSVWCSRQSAELTESMVKAFKEKYSDEADFRITISIEEELSCKETVLANPSSAADIYTFAADQFIELYNAGALLEITDEKEQIIAENGGNENGAVRSASVDGGLYAYPTTASNGYFLYYNTHYLTSEDVKSFDRILQVAEESGKKAAMDFTSGWYIYSFFKGAGLNVELNDDGITNSCDWNSTSGKFSGVDVAEAMLKIASSDGFISCGDGDFVNGAKDGSIIAGINGAWNAAEIEAAFGDGYAAAKLPEYTVAGERVQMCSFAGYKLTGVNAYTAYPEWSMRLARWFTNEENQTERFRVIGEGPSNINAASSEEVKKSPAIAALNEQSAYGYLQNVGSSFWTPTFVFGTTIAAGNIDGTDLQELLDTMVEGIEAVPEPEAAQ